MLSKFTEEKLTVEKSCFEELLAIENETNIS